MTHAVDPALAFLTVGAFLYAALGIWILTLKPRRRQTLLLGAFAIVYGLQFATVDVLRIFDLITFGSLANAALVAPFAVLAHSLALSLAWMVPHPPEDRRPLWIALVLGLGLALLYGGSFLAVGRLAGVAVTGMALWTWSLFFASFGILGAAMVLLALRAHPSRASGGGAVTQLALLTVALGLLIVFDGGSGISTSARGLAVGDRGLFLSGTAGPILGLAVAGLWGWNMLQARDGTTRVHRAAMLGILGMLAAGAVYFAAIPGARGGTNMGRGVMRTLGVGLLAYGVLRHDLAGLDAKVEWGVSKTTVAGIFIAVFFIVSEGAQALFADFAGSELIGVVAAGMLVFAISPLQRMADRFAAKAVPGGAQVGQDVEEQYRAFVEMALADGELSREEERQLAKRAASLGIDADRAFELREEVEDEIGAGEASA